MSKRLSWFAPLCAILVIGILICLGLIVGMLLSWPTQPSNLQGAQFVREAMLYAAI